MSSKTTLLVLPLLLQTSLAFPWVASAPGVDSALLHSSRHRRQADLNCAFNPNHENAAPLSSQFPYNNARFPFPGNGRGGYLVPAPGDTAHEFRAPRAGIDIRGPCPGLNAAANHGFLARDGIVTYGELVDAQQNMYNVGFDLANVLAIAGVGLDGDLLSGKVSLGCDATSRTKSPLSLLASQPGLNGHNKFEADASLTRGDFFTTNNFRLNTTLFTMMMETCQGNCGRQELSVYREERWQQSVAENGNFFFGPGSLLLYGAASFLYELFPGEGGSPDEATMMSFFSIDKAADGSYVENSGERAPPNWRPRVAPYSGSDVVREIVAMYIANPVLFGGNVGQNNFIGLNSGAAIRDGRLVDTAPSAILCLLFQALQSAIPATVGQAVNLPVNILNQITQLAPFATNIGCPSNPNDGGSGADIPILPDLGLPPLVIPSLPPLPLPLPDLPIRLPPLPPLLGPSRPGQGGGLLGGLFPRAN
ncbi:Dothistromin biosynthesis peroxidase dotB [Fulvia fulva]|uniref:Dothistromin biosynthesis peroxidase dotB n=1 Tax=Passalora fulva TaxID=5499 RepID=A0A9Q8LGX0_PASFU|nr:Dothistromin biosynthesis peroxidase dotB [Fulvia fulva]UJO16959.1 Dothistromin biosynthesis peroxidase dotB [Fulvia fulva]